MHRDPQDEVADAGRHDIDTKVVRELRSRLKLANDQYLIRLALETLGSKGTLIDHD